MKKSYLEVENFQIRLEIQGLAWNIFKLITILNTHGVHNSKFRQNDNNTQYGGRDTIVNFAKRMTILNTGVGTQ